MGMFVRALAYMMSHGADGLRQVAEDAVLNANYVRVRLADALSQAFPGICMHEVLFDDEFLKDTGVTTLDFAKAMIDEGYHPMTMYFPLVVHGALLIEPTETESKASLDQFVAVLRGLAERAQSSKRGAGDAASFRAAPQLTPRRRLDETAAALRFYRRQGFVRVGRLPDLVRQRRLGPLDARRIDGAPSTGSFGARSRSVPDRIRSRQAGDASNTEQEPPTDGRGCPRSRASGGTSGWRSPPDRRRPDLERRHPYPANTGAGFRLRGASGAGSGSHIPRHPRAPRDWEDVHRREDRP
jgi:hypothetical protein